MAKQVNEINTIISEMKEYDNKREFVIQNSRDIIRLSKTVIYSVHRHELPKADTVLKDLVNIIEKIEKIVGKDQKLYYVGSYYVAMQEYVEAAAFLHFAKTGELLAKKALSVENEEYLCGLADFTGELTRMALLSSIGKDYGKVVKVRDMIDYIYGILSKMDIRNSDLRKKVDMTRWNLNKVEDILYQIKIKGVI